MPAVLVLMVGSPNRAEWPLNDLGSGSQAFKHIEQHVIVGDVNRSLRDLRGHMPVADVPGQSEKIEGLVGRDLDQPLRRCPHLHQPACVETDGVPIFQYVGLVEIEQESRAAIGVQHDPAAVAVAMVEGDDIDDAVVLDRFTGDDGRGADHVQNRK
jgi:hypothetical protein